MPATPSRTFGLGLICLLAAGCASRSVSVDAPQASAPRARSIKPLFVERFTALDPERWREVEVKRQTHYALDNETLKAVSRDGASIMLTEVRFDPDEHEWLSWRWRVDQALADEALETKDGSDAAARVYVYFDSTGLPWQKKNIDYVWSRHLPVGTIIDSAFSKSSKIIVIDSGAEHLGAWRSVARNMEEDYERCFGTKGEVPDVVAIGLMSDSDNTHGQAVAFFDDLMVSRELPALVADESGATAERLAADAP